MTELFEAFMIVSFGISWPMSIIKSYTSGTAKGKSLIFLLFILFGYCCGVISKVASGKITYVFAFYILNLLMVSTDLVLYFRNNKKDTERDAMLEPRVEIDA